MSDHSGIAWTNAIHRPVMRYHGGKWRLADWIMGFFPPHHTYVEPFGGAAGVLMRKPRSRAEVYNDLDGDVVNVFRILRDPEQAQRLEELCALTPYARAEFDLAYEENSDPVERARRTLFRASAGFGSACATKGRSGFRSYSADKRHNSPAVDWLNLPQNISLFCERLRGVLIENQPAIEIVRHFDSTNTLFYVDPPYLPETRKMGGGRYYLHEMTAEDHKALLPALLDTQGAVVLSGYSSDLYDTLLHGWQRFARQTQANGRTGSAIRTECIWINPRCADGMQQQRLF